MSGRGLEGVIELLEGLEPEELAAVVTEAIARRLYDPDDRSGAHRRQFARWLALELEVPGLADVARDDPIVAQVRRLDRVGLSMGLDAALAVGLVAASRARLEAERRLLELASATPASYVIPTLRADPLGARPWTAAEIARELAAGVTTVAELQADAARASEAIRLAELEG